MIATIRSYCYRDKTRLSMHQMGLLINTTCYFLVSLPDVPGHLKPNVQNPTHPQHLHICSFLSILYPNYHNHDPFIPSNRNPGSITSFHCYIYSAIISYEWQPSNLPSLLHVIWNWLNSGPHFSSEYCNSSFLPVLFPPECSPRSFQKLIFKIIIMLLSFKTLYCDFYAEPSGFCSNMTNQTYVVISIPS